MSRSEAVVVGITGASGAMYGIRLLESLRELSIPTHLIISKAAHLTIPTETDYALADVKALATHYYPTQDVGACIASGSFKTRGMVVAPCSIKSMSEIASGVTSSLLTRAADVMLKERRPLILMVRETPFHAGHLETMLKLAQIGAIIAPPLPAFYHRPTTISELINHSVGRTLNLLGIENRLSEEWKGI